MKFVFLSILCSILLSNFCFAMDQQDLNLNKKLPNSTSIDILADWDTLDDAIQTNKENQSNKNKKTPTGWFPITNFIIKSFHKKPIQKTIDFIDESKQTTTISDKITEIVTTLPIETTTTNINQDKNKQDEIVDTMQTIITIKNNNNFHENLSQHNNSNDTAPINNNIVTLQNVPVIINPLQPNKIFNNMNIDRNLNNPSTENNSQETISLFTIFQKGCCSCLDVFSDLEYKKKSNKS